MPFPKTAAVALLLLAGSLATATAAETSLPGAIAAPGETILLTAHAEGAQVYECKAGSDGKPAWAFREPIATLLVDLARRERPDARLASFNFKAVRPTFDLHAFRVCGRPSADGKGAQLWAQDHEGWLTMQGEATFA